MKQLRDLLKSNGISIIPGSKLDNSISSLSKTVDSVKDKFNNAESVISTKLDQAEAKIKEQELLVKRKVIPGLRRILKTFETETEDLAGSKFVYKSIAAVENLGTVASSTLPAIPDAAKRISELNAATKRSVITQSTKEVRNRRLYNAQGKVLVLQTASEARVVTI